MLSWQCVSLNTLPVGSFCELDVLYALGRQRLDEYELAAQRLNNIYFTTLKTLGYSPDYYELQGVYLLYLLSFNKQHRIYIGWIGSFYSEIELLPREALDHSSISYVLQIEQALSIGNYSAVKSENPVTGLGSIFLNRIVETIRDQTAMSASRAYQRIKVHDALHLFHMSNVDDLQRYAVNNNYSWQFDDQYVYIEQVCDMRLSSVNPWRTHLTRKC